MVTGAPWRSAAWAAWASGVVSQPSIPLAARQRPVQTFLFVAPLAPDALLKFHAEGGIPSVIRPPGRPFPPSVLDCISFQQLEFLDITTLQLIGPTGTTTTLHQHRQDPDRAGHQPRQRVPDQGLRGIVCKWPGLRVRG